MDADERSELQRLRREMEICSLGDRPSSMSALRLGRLIELEAREIQDYAARQLNHQHRYTLGDLNVLATDFC